MDFIFNLDKQKRFDIRLGGLLFINLVQDNGESLTLLHYFDKKCNPKQRKFNDLADAIRWAYKNRPLSFESHHCSTIPTNVPGVLKVEKLV